MKKRFIFFVSVLFSVFFTVNTFGQDMLEKYQRAEQFMAGNISRIIYNESFYPNFINKGSNFWYKNESENGYEYFIVNPDKGKNKIAFNHKNLAQKLSQELDEEISPFKLDLSSLEFIQDEEEITFKKNEINWKYNTKKKTLLKQEKDQESKHEIKSPDHNWIAFIKDYNVWIINIELKDTFQLSFDGSEKFAYGITHSWYSLKNESGKGKEEIETIIYWSPDSKKLIVPKYDRRNAKKLYLYKTTPDEGFRSEVFSYERPLAGDSLLTTVEYSLFFVDEKKQIDLNISPNATFLNFSIEWLPSGLKAYLLKYSRGYQSRKLVEIDANTGEVNLLLIETSDTYTDPLNHSYFLLEEVGLLLWTSEKSGWNHIYLHDLETGSLVKQVTTGEFAVNEIKCIDQQKSRIYFTAYGKEEGDPYYNYLYVTDFSGNFIRKITQEEAYHILYKSPDKKYFVDVFSNYITPTKSNIYRISNSENVMSVTVADVSKLNALGYKNPKAFQLKARDDTSEIYGLMYLPTDFDSTKKYPVIDATYSGPHTIRTPKTFRRVVLNNELAIAELGFVVVTIDGLGTAFRSKKFHDFSYKNLGDIGCEDHVKAIKELAKKNNFIDTSRVGIYGHSAGGYDAVRALILRPDFYKVAVSSAGNHDHRIAKAWWPELYMGYPARKHYDEQSNILNAEKIKGKLLLVHGNMDNNVNPAGSLRLSDALIKANKDFDIIITPGDDHGKLYYNNYFIRKRWDFFVEHLLKVPVPKEYKIKKESVY